MKPDLQTVAIFFAGVATLLNLFMSQRWFAAIESRFNSVDASTRGNRQAIDRLNERMTADVHVLNERLTAQIAELREQLLRSGAHRRGLF